VTQHHSCASPLGIPPRASGGKTSYPRVPSTDSSARNPGRRVAEIQQRIRAQAGPALEPSIEGVSRDCRCGGEVDKQARRLAHAAIGWPAKRPYRSIGVEPMVGRTLTCRPALGPFPLGSQTKLRTRPPMTRRYGRRHTTESLKTCSGDSRVQRASATPVCFRCKGFPLALPNRTMTCPVPNSCPIPCATAVTHGQSSSAFSVARKEKA